MQTDVKWNAGKQEAGKRKEEKECAVYLLKRLGN